MKRERTSYAFLMEMIWVCAFFLICASIFVTAFAKAEKVSREADLLNQAVQASSNVLEECFSVANPEAFDEILSVYSTDDYSLAMEWTIEDGLLSLTVSAVDAKDGTTIYALSGTRTVVPSLDGDHSSGRITTLEGGAS